MGKQTEMWLNVHQRRDGSRFLMPWADKNLSTQSAYLNRDHRERPVLYRIHVRLKPEGAPERYASEQDRQWWENLCASPKQQAALRQRLETGIGAAHGHLWLTDPALDGRRPPEMTARVEADIRTRFPSV